MYSVSPAFYALQGISVFGLMLLTACSTQAVPVASHPMLNTVQNNVSPEVADPALSASPQMKFSDFHSGKRIRTDKRPVNAIAPDTERHQVSLNKVPIETAAQIILHDKLGYAVLMDTKLEGRISLEARQGISKQDLLRLFGSALRDSGANLTISGGTAVIKVGDVFPLPRHESGAGISFLQLEHFAANDFVELASSMVGQSVQLRSDPGSNTIIVSGPSLNVDGILELAHEMDRPEWRFASFAFIPVHDSSGEAAANLVEEVFAGSSAPTVKARYVAGLEALWVIGISENAIARARQVVAQFESFAEQSRPRQIVWPLKSATATKLAPLLTSILSASKSGARLASLNSDTAMTIGTVSRSQSNTPGSRRASGNSIFSNSQDQQDRSQGGSNDGAAPTLAGPLDIADEIQNPTSRGGSDQIFADPETNSLIFNLSPKKWRQILPVLVELDRPVTQVHIAVDIFEITLTDTMSYGLQHAISFGNLSWVLSNTASSVLTPALPGLAIAMEFEQARPLSRPTRQNDHPVHAEHAKPDDPEWRGG